MLFRSIGNIVSVNVSEFTITFVRTKDIDSSCSLCNEGILYISPQRDKSNFKCFVTSKYAVVTRHSEDLMGEYVYILS